LFVLAGGSGTRFWPKSTPEKPKQLLSFGSKERGSKTLLEETLSRLDGRVELESKWVLTTTKLAPTIRNLLGDSKVKVLAEPIARNTAPCLFWAARELVAQDPEGVMIVLPSDHFIADLQAFSRTIQAAVVHAMETEDLVTLGVKPERPETGYGYLELEPSTKLPIRLRRFVEKPDLKRAEEFVAAGNFLWNGGMFVWKAKSLLAEFSRFMPEMDQIWNECEREVLRAYPKLTATSIDYGVMEKSDHVVTFPLDCGWDDLGSWTSLETMADRLGIRHSAGVKLAGEVRSLDSHSNILDVEDLRVSLLGVDDLIIVQSGRELLIAKKSRAQEIKKLTELS
jgi:mannose-1-phosphate guanylyltransferase